jgi:arabinose-5-phosphate isomerase
MSAASNERPANRLTPPRSADDAAQRATEQELATMAREVFQQQSDALAAIAGSVGAGFAEAVRQVYACSGRVLVTGLGKSGLIGRKVAATLTSTGTPALFVHPVEALHGDLGIATADDVLILISRSGSNEELLVLQSSLAEMGLRSIAITGAPESPLARRADVVLPTVIQGEACPLDLTPTTSTTAALVMGDALALALLRLRDFRREDFAVFHPSGALGRALRMSVRELMHDGDRMPVVREDANLREALLVIAEKRLGCTCVVDAQGALAGFLTDGDLKRILLRDADPLDRPVAEIMTTSPRTVSPDCLARVALRKMEGNPGGAITQLVVAQEGRPLGVVHMHDILKLGFFS